MKSVHIVLALESILLHSFDVDQKYIWRTTITLKKQNKTLRKMFCLYKILCRCAHGKYPYEHPLKMARAVFSQQTYLNFSGIFQNFSYILLLLPLNISKFSVLRQECLISVSPMTLPYSTPAAEPQTGIHSLIAWRRTPSEFTLFFTVSFAFPWNVVQNVWNLLLRNIIF